MWRPALLVVALAACRGSSSSGATGMALVHVQLGDRAGAGIGVVSHDVHGRVIESAMTDATGLASVGTDDSGLLTVVFGPEVLATTSVADGGEVTIVGPPAMPPSLVVGTLQVVPPTPLANVDHYDIALGCTTIEVMALPATVDVIAPCLGTDTNLDVLVTAVRGGAVVAYMAGRVPLQNSAASFVPDAWAMAMTRVPLALTGVAPTQLDWTLLADGLPFDRAALTDHGDVPVGLVVDRALVHAEIDGAATLLALGGAPAEIQLGPDDFLAPLPHTLAREGTSFSWTAPKIADVVDLFARWDHLTWNAILPPTADRVSLPLLDGIDPSGPLTAELRVIDAGGALPALHVEDAGRPSTIAPVPATGVIREARATEQY